LRWLRGLPMDTALRTCTGSALVCVEQSEPAINARHHAVVRLLAEAAALLLKTPARIELYNPVLR
jgi:hypothetical protein